MNIINSVKRLLITYKRFKTNLPLEDNNNELLNYVLSIKIQDKYKSVENFSNNIDKIFVRGLIHMIECNDIKNELFNIFLETYVSLSKDDSDKLFTDLSNVLNKQVVPINECLDELYSINKSVNLYWRR